MKSEEVGHLERETEENRREEESYLLNGPPPHPPTPSPFTFLWYSYFKILKIILYFDIKYWCTNTCIHGWRTSDSRSRWSMLSHSDWSVCCLKQIFCNWWRQLKNDQASSTSMASYQISISFPILLILSLLGFVVELFWALRTL